ncbi:MAG: PPOX class F420-dependent oxidoreductase [Acidimicrobiales bacterium]
MSIADHRYVSFTTFKRDGSPVALPVWIAPLGDGRVAFTTDPESWKAKRLANDPRVELRPSDVRGKVPDGAEVVTGTGVVVTEGPDLDAAKAAIRKAYGIQYQALVWGAALKRLLRLHQAPEAAVVVTPDAPAA